MTTDLGGVAGHSNMYGTPSPDYTDGFGGTSGATPIVAGALALAKEIQHDLDSRFAKHLLANSSLPVDLEDHSPESDGGWRENAAGCRFNQNYGFGLVNADGLVTLAGLGNLQVTPLSTWDSLPLEPRDGSIPDDDDDGIAFSIDFGGQGDSVDRLEEVGVSLRIDHTRRGELEVLLVSPSGTTGRMMHRYNSDTDADASSGVDWTFWSHAFWGEWPVGEWSLIVRDTERGTVGVVEELQLHLRMGRLTLGSTYFGPCDLASHVMPTRP